MSALIYRQHYADNTSALKRRAVKQGRTPLPVEMKKIRTNITTSREAKKIITAKARKMGMSFSAYLELAGVLYTPELLKS
jgi:hypothetical protein